MIQLVHFKNTVTLEENAASLQTMAVAKSQEYERRVRSLKKRLTLDFQPLRDTLSRGLDVLIDSEAAVLCTATVEAMCDALFNVVVKNVHDDAASSLAPLDTKVTIYHLQVALRSHPDFAQLLQSVDSAAAVLEFFLDDATSKSLYQRHLLQTREAKHLRVCINTRDDGVDADDLVQHEHAAGAAQLSDDQLIALHERTRSEWQKREDDPFTDVDFAMVLKCVHPAFTLAHSATLLLSALVRELVNEVCDYANIESVQQRVPPELYVEDLATPLARVFHVGGELGPQIERTASECLERFRLRSRHGATLTLRSRVFLRAHGTTGTGNGSTYTLANVARDATFAQIVVQMCRKCHLDAATTVGIYRGHQLDTSACPAALSMPTGAVVYLVSRKWWDHTRRNEARRGLLSSLRPQDAQLRNLVESTESKVKREFQGGGGSDSSTTTTGGGGGGGAHGPFGFLAPAASPGKVLSVESSKRVTKRRGGRGGRGTGGERTINQSVHAASASRLMGVGGAGTSHYFVSASPPRRRQSSSGGEEEFADDGDEGAEGDDKTDFHCNRSGGQEDDSLSSLLRQRPQPRRGRSDRNTVGKKNPVVMSPTQRTAEPNKTSREVVATLAMQSAQLMDTLDEAWLGFAGISASVRAIKEAIQSQLADVAEGGDGGADEAVADLEQELCQRLEKTSELVRQTTLAHELVAQLHRGTRRLRGGPELARR